MMKKFVLGSVALALVSVATADHDEPIYRRIQQSKAAKKGGDSPPPPPSRTEGISSNEKGDKAGRTQGTGRTRHSTTQRTAPEEEQGSKKAKRVGGTRTRTGRTGRPQRGGTTEALTTRMKTEQTGSATPDDTGRHVPSDDWYDDFFEYYDDQYPGDIQLDDLYYNDDQYADDQYAEVPGDDQYYEGGNGIYDDLYVDDHYYETDDHYTGMDDTYVDDQYYEGGKGGGYDDYYYSSGKGKGKGGSSKSSKSCKGSKSKKGSKKCSKKGSKKGSPKYEDDM